MRNKEKSRAHVVYGVTAVPSFLHLPLEGRTNPARVIYFFVLAPLLVSRWFDGDGTRTIWASIGEIINANHNKVRRCPILPGN